MAYKKLFPNTFGATDCLQILGGGHQARIRPSFDVLVWNIYKARKREWEKDFLSLAEGKDLVLLQEAVLKTRFDPLFNIAEKMEWVMARSHVYSSSQMETGVKTGSVVPSASSSFFISPDTEPFFKTPKILLATAYPLEGSLHTLLVVNVHAINFVSFGKYSRQLDQIVQAVGSHEGPLLLAGDFNTWNAARNRGLRALTQNMNLNELPLERRGRFQHFNQHLDHVFYRGLEPVQATVTAVRSSDHYPIAVTFRTVQS